MRIAAAQPEYLKATTAKEASNSLLERLGWLESHDFNNTDLIVLPEYFNSAGIEDKDMALYLCDNSARAATDRLSRLSAHIGVAIAVNMLEHADGLLRNRTSLIENGKRIDYYDKVHLTTLEKEWGITPGTKAKIVEWHGARIGFATCFDVYFPSFFEKIANARPDIIIFPTYQRSEKSSICELQTRARALDTESFVIRSSYMIRNEPDKAGKTMVADPMGNVAADAGHEKTVLFLTIDEHTKRIRPEVYGGREMPNRDIIENCTELAE